MIQKDITFCQQPQTVACDGQCHKAWGISRRPKEQLSEDHDDYAWLADHELGFAPADPGTTEGDHAKPCNTIARDPAIINKWCVRQCERSVMVDRGTPIVLRSFESRRYNIPRKHQEG